MRLDISLESYLALLSAPLFPRRRYVAAGLGLALCTLQANMEGDGEPAGLCPP